MINQCKTSWLLLIFLFVTNYSIAQFVGINTQSPQTELDIRTLSTNDGSIINLGNLDNSHFLRFFSGRDSIFPYPIVYWNNGDSLSMGTWGSGYEEILKLRSDGSMYLNSAQGIRLNEGNLPLITRGYDLFTGGVYQGIGRWGLFMEPFYLTLGIPNIPGRGFQFVDYNPDGSIESTMMRLKDGNLGIGVFDPQFRIDALAPQAVARLISSNTPNGSVLELGNTSFTDESDFIGAINFSNDVGVTTGQIAYTHEGSMIFKAGNFERMRVHYINGYVGINQINPQYQLDVNGHTNLGGNTYVSGDIDLSGALRIGGNFGTPGQILTSNGNSTPSWVSQSENPTIGFSAYLNSDNFTSSGVWNDLEDFTEEFEDGGDNFYPLLGEYTVPSSGLYSFAIHTEWEYNTTELTNVPVSLSIRVGIGENQTTKAEANKIIQLLNNGFNDSVDLTRLIKLNAGDIVTFKAQQFSGGTAILLGNGGTAKTHVSCYKIY